MHGRGLNSIRWRFTLASIILTLAGVTLRDAGLDPDWRPDAAWLLTLALLTLAIAAATFWMASRLTGLIASLKRSTDAIAAGDFDAPVDVDCACEVGGLAHSFRQMTSRLNANILRMNALAHVDAITGLPNRSVIDHLLRYALDSEREGRFRAAIVFIDLDGFKRINDTLGHAGGDQLLRLASQRILERGLQRTHATLDTCMDPFGNPCERLPEDIVFARFAGDEFVAVLPGQTDRTRLAGVGEAIIEALREPFHIKNQDVVVGASIGIAIAPDDTDCAEELLTFADLAMYSSKQAGKARCMFFDKKIRETLVARARVEADLRLALQRDELLLHFQPKVDTQTLEIGCVEALVRWQHPMRGLLMPADFIDVAEQSGLMSPLGQQVMVLALAQCRRWLDQGIERPVAVNVSPSQFVEPDFVPGLLKLLSQSGVPARLLSIEITESIAMTDFEMNVLRLGSLRAAGVRVAIDDFGIGYSNLSQLARLPMDELKIDRSLIAAIGRSEKSEAIIRAILSMARALGYRSIAEGIETAEQLAFLRDLGCDALQGYLFGRPMPAAQIEDWAAARRAGLQVAVTA
ncbi:putative bifunctional diguanylate cyclase/phosphodiesterase [Sphaerotilus mobilis]|uniref:Diguanylate cyclase/phosphodiesterase n=1 Tax=Sphaerotilus mobilis TaxID=47994 RepID=A0A4Q7LT49_9BURK|nr:EAL domain-containing protein [Sphaerotilus mobilis]RZS56919.1 diguanylate cyclase/phosphodiesterase [Sphaerotilus mobilis]